MTQPNQKLNQNQNEPEPVVEKPQPKSSLSFIETKGLTSYYVIEGDAFKVLIQLSGVSWVDIKNAKGNTFYAGQPSEGDEISEDFGGEEEIIFNFGASQNVQLTINGEVVKLPLEKNQQKINIRFEKEQ